MSINSRMDNADVELIYDGIYEIMGRLHNTVYQENPGTDKQNLDSRC